MRPAGTGAPEVPLLPGELDRPAAPPARSRRVAEAVAAARRILEEEGAPGLTMRRLADEMGIRAPSLYKHFSGKADLELLLIEDALFDVGEATHRALHPSGHESPLLNLLLTYRVHSLARPNLYRLATNGPLARQRLPEGLEEWAGNPWFVVTGDPSLAQALWSLAHGMVILELDDRYPRGSDLELTWRAGAAAFERAADVGRAGTP
ncbi:MAG TPA: TetR/AcrR family transcriptional regulator [Acidimicrobiales bacterium]